MTADEVKAELERVGLVPVLRAKSIPEAHALVEAIYAGGVTVLEITMTVPGAIDLLRDLRAKYGSEVLLGSGTVTTAAQAEATIAAGAEFVVSPSLHLEVIAKTKELGKVSIPGALTPTEVITAWEAGADYVKVFPCSAMGGASYLKALRAPFPQLKLIPTGGVTVATAADFLKAGAVALGVGSDLVNATAIAEGKSWIVTDMARAYMDVIQETRSVKAS
jgi:2-dehydro-3-deoxyphosphogluconate aldolase / (4S)-4-hydroxy-2-oxoglutarate aldolase